MAARVHEHDLNLLPPADLAGEMERLREELRNERDRNLRTLADFKNYRRRVESEGGKFAQEGKREIILPLLDIIDDMEKALQWTGDGEHPSIPGLRIIYRKFLALLATHGVLPFESVGTPFSHHLHEAVATVKHTSSASGTVVDELRRGYLWKNEVLRPAQVRVAA